MEQISNAIVAALAEGASAQLKDGASEAVKDAYAALKKLIEARVSAQDVQALEAKPSSTSRRAIVEEELEKADASGDPALAAAAERLLRLVKPRTPANITARSASPTRGALRLDVSTSTTILSSGSDFSIFVNISNPFDIPVTIYQVLTHIPIELIDRNTVRLLQTQRENERAASGKSEFKKFYEQLRDRLFPPSPSGVCRCGWK